MWTLTQGMYRRETCSLLHASSTPPCCTLSSPSQDESSPPQASFLSLRRMQNSLHFKLDRRQAPRPLGGPPSNLRDASNASVSQEKYVGSYVCVAEEVVDSSVGLVAGHGRCRPPQSLSRCVFCSSLSFLWPSYYPAGHITRCRG